MRTYSFAEYQDAADVIKNRINITPEIGLVLGSGLGQLADEVEGVEPGSDPVVIAYKDIPGHKPVTYPGNGCRILPCSGRTADCCLPYPQNRYDP